MSICLMSTQPLMDGISFQPLESPVLSSSLPNQSHVLGIPGATVLPAQILSHEVFWGVLETGSLERQWDLSKASQAVRWFTRETDSFHPSCYPASLEHASLPRPHMASQHLSSVQPAAGFQKVSTGRTDHVGASGPSLHGNSCLCGQGIFPLT